MEQGSNSNKAGLIATIITSLVSILVAILGFFNFNDFKTFFINNEEREIVSYFVNSGNSLKCDTTNIMFSKISFESGNKILKINGLGIILDSTVIESDDENMFSGEYEVKYLFDEKISDYLSKSENILVSKLYSERINLTIRLSNDFKKMDILTFPIKNKLIKFSIKSIIWQRRPIVEFTIYKQT